TSATSRYEEGLLKGNDLNRTSLKANFDAYPTDNFTIKASTNYVLNTNNRQLLDNAFGPLNNTLFISDKQIWSKTGSKEAVYARSDELKTNRFIGSLNLSWTPFEDFELRGSAGYDGSDMREDVTQPFGYAYGGDDDGTREIFTRENRQQNYQVSARYSYQPLSDLSITSIIGSQIFSREVNTITLNKQNFPVQGITNIGAGDQLINADETALQTREAG